RGSAAAGEPRHRRPRRKAHARLQAVERGAQAAAVREAEGDHREAPHGARPCLRALRLYEERDPRGRLRASGRYVPVRVRPVHVGARRRLQGSRAGQPLCRRHECLPEHRSGQPGAHSDGELAARRGPSARATRREGHGRRSRRPVSVVANTTVDLARVQFATTSIYHFLFVPLTLGLGPLVAIMQTAWYRTRNEQWLRLTKFFGTLFLINFAIGVATGLVQEFEFGMNWSVYSKFVGNVFGAPLAVEGLAAFMLEATFLGVWIFGWNRLPPKLHLATLWIAVLGTWLSGYFILVANSWMQHPVGYKIVNGEAQLTS